MNEKIKSFYKAQKKISKLKTWKVCLHPNAKKSTCSKGIISAHSVRRSADLKLIAENGHVYKTAINNNIRSINFNELDIELVGIKNASTFYGRLNYSSLLEITDNIIDGPVWFEDEP